MFENAKTKWQTFLNTLGLGDTPEKLRESNPYSREDNNAYNNIQNKILNSNLINPQNPYETASNFESQKLPIPPKETDVFKQQIQPKQQQNKIDLSLFQTSGGQTVPNPDQTLTNDIYANFPDYKEASRAAAVQWSENANRNQDAININKDGSKDYGLFQINNGTFNDMLSKNKYKKMLEEYGITKEEDLLDPQKNVVAAAVVKQYEEEAGAKPWSWWYGHKDKGIDLYPKDI